MERPALDERIEQRANRQLEAGWVDEVRALLAAGYSPSLSSFRSIGYREIAAHIEGQMPGDEMRQAIVSKTRRFARSQFAWFRAADERIAWLDVAAGTGTLPETLRDIIGA